MEELTLADCFAILRRWKKVFAITFIVLFAISAKIALSWSTYRSTATVQIEQSQVSAEATTLMGSALNQREALADQRISALQQRVLSTASLIEIITKFQLYPEERKKTPIATVATEMRKKIKLTLVSSSFANPSAASRLQASAIAFTISFDYTNPLVTQQVTDEMVSRFLNEDLKERRTEAKETSAFLGAQIAELEATLSEQEKTIAEYQKEHGVTRPENLAFNQQMAENVTRNIQSLDGQIMSSEGTLGALRAQLAATDPYSRILSEGQVLTSPTIQLKALQSHYASLTAQYGAAHPDVIKARRQIAGLQAETGRATKEATQLKAQITDVRTRLTAAEKTYGAEHPDVVNLRAQVQKLEDRLAKTRLSAADPDEAIVSDADNPVYLQIAAQLRAAEKQNEALVRQRKEVGVQQEKYQKAIIENPEAMKKMATLSRDYDNAQLRYRELKAKKMAADMDEKLQKDRTGERLSLINPPELPLNTQPPKILLFMAGAFLSFVGSFASIVLFQVLSQSVVGPHHLESIVGVAPLVAVPHIYTTEERRRSWQTRTHLLIAQMFRQTVEGIALFCARYETLTRFGKWVSKVFTRSLAPDKDTPKL